MSGWVLFAAAVGCGIGATIRYLLGRVDHPQSFPWPTVTANALGSAIFGAATAVALTTSGGEATAIILGGGLAGGLTTFSSLAVDALVLWRDGRRQACFAYLALTFATGVGAAGLGWLVATGFAS